MSECIVRDDAKLYKDEFGIVRYKDFIRSDMMFWHAIIPIRTGKTISECIYVRCPNCGKIGRLASKGKRASGLRLYAIMHRNKRTACGYVNCRVTVTHTAHDYIDMIYHKYRLKTDKR